VADPTPDPLGTIRTDGDRFALRADYEHELLWLVGRPSAAGNLAGIEVLPHAYVADWPIVESPWSRLAVEPCGEELHPHRRCSKPRGHGPHSDGGVSWVVEHVDQDGDAYRFLRDAIDELIPGDDQPGRSWDGDEAEEEILRQFVAHAVDWAKAANGGVYPPRGVRPPDLPELHRAQETPDCSPTCVNCQAQRRLYALARYFDGMGRWQLADALNQAAETAGRKDIVGTAAAKLVVPPAPDAEDAR
jgi:hypothetical protein